MKAGLKFKIINWTVYSLQLIFAASMVFAWIKFKENYELIYLFLSIFFLVMSFVFYNLGVMHRREIGVKLERSFKNDLVDKLNRRGRRRLKKMNRRIMKKNQIK